MDDRSAQIATICECINHCFAFALWCKDFVEFLDPGDMVAGLDRGAEVVSDATRLTSFLSLRKLDDFLRGTKSKAGDLIASDFGIDVPSVLGDVGKTFLTTTERDKINKQAAHLTEHLWLDPDTEVDLQEILTRSMPVLTRLVPELRKADTSQEAAHWLAKTDALIARCQTQ
jgi:hypothetical protein